jgi:hypothetical protein
VERGDQLDVGGGERLLDHEYGREHGGVLVYSCGVYT